VSLKQWIIALLTGVFGCQSSLALTVSEIMYHPSNSGLGNLEFIELYNDRAVFEDLSGLFFSEGVSYAFESGTLLPPKAYVVIAKDPTAIQAAYGNSTVLGPYTGSLSNSGERIVLSLINGPCILDVEYKDIHPWPLACDGTGHSLTLKRLGGDLNDPFTWQASALSGGTPGAPDQSQLEQDEPKTGITLVGLNHPGRFLKGMYEPSAQGNGSPSLAWTQVSFNDTPGRTTWMDGLNGYGYSNAQNELQYINTPLNDMPDAYLSIYARLVFSLTDDEILRFATLHTNVHYDDGFVLYLNGVRVAASDNMPASIPAHDQAASTATDPPVFSADLTEYSGLLVPGQNVLSIQVHNASLSGSSDCLAAPTLEATFSASQTILSLASQLKINEIYFSGQATTIEIFNPGPHPIDLSTVYLSHDAAQLLEQRLADNGMLAPGDFLTLDTDFALPASDQTLYLTQTFLAGTGSFRVLDAVHYDGLQPSLSFGRFPDGSNILDHLAWPTLGQTNALPHMGPIVINEIMYHHPTDDNRYEFVELYNRSDATVSLDGWSLADGIEFQFPASASLAPGAYVVVAKDPGFMESTDTHLAHGQNLFGPFQGSLSNSNDRIALIHSNPVPVVQDEVTYADQGPWPSWADGDGASLELIDPHSDNHTAQAWADSDELSKSPWTHFSLTIEGSDRRYTHSSVNLFDMMLLSRGEVLLDDISCRINNAEQLSNRGFESQDNNWRLLGNHVQSHVSSMDARSGSHCLHLIATGHGDTGANRINQSLGNVTAQTITLSGWAKWSRGSRFLLTRTVRTRSPVQPPWPSHTFELPMPVSLGTPGLPNSVLATNRGPDIQAVTHHPVLPQADEPVTVTAQVTDRHGVNSVTLWYGSEENSALTPMTMMDNGQGPDTLAGDATYSATIPGDRQGALVQFYVEASDSLLSSRFPTRLPSSAEVPNRTCLIRFQDTTANTSLATYRVWLSDEVINTFQNRSNLSNELLDCTFVYNDSEVFYNAGIRFRGSPWLRPGSRRDPRDRYAYRIEFNNGRTLHGQKDVNIDNTEGSNRGPLQERASYWFLKEMGLPYCRQEFVRMIINGKSRTSYEHVQKIDRDYLNKWFPDDAQGELHKIDDYFELDASGTSQSYLDEGLKYDAQHPLLKETYRWGFERRSGSESDSWDHFFELAQVLNKNPRDPDYEQSIEAIMDVNEFVSVLAMQHVFGNWDTYAYDRGKNSFLYYAPNENKWRLLPWDIDFTLGSGDGANNPLFPVNPGIFPAEANLLFYAKYRAQYAQTLIELIEGPFQTAYGTADPPTPFDVYLDDAADVLIQDGGDASRRNSIKQFVKSRREFIQKQLSPSLFKISPQNGEFFVASGTTPVQGTAPPQVHSVLVNGVPTPIIMISSNRFEVQVPVNGMDDMEITLQGLDFKGQPIEGALDSTILTYRGR